jgi:chromosome segregation protein
MTNKMKILFNENFQKLRANFNETFKELFKGGSADLILAEGNELTSNIEINVQPPGKKLQNINLMSGGEKGLSAIALLFAILKMKPTPFCILDEIEASLDDANVHRYAEFLKKFSTNIQFIIITHRKGTMEASDVLYGVTMEEKGVSKVISVDLEVS